MMSETARKQRHRHDFTDHHRAAHGDKDMYQDTVKTSGTARKQSDIVTASQTTTVLHIVTKIGTRIQL